MNSEQDEEIRIPVVEERLDVRKEDVETGRVRLSSRVEEEERLIRDTLRRSDVRVERRPVDRVSDEPPAMREEADRLVVPVYEEVMVKQWLVREEVHLVTEATQEPFEDRIVLRRNRVDVERD